VTYASVTTPPPDVVPHTDLDHTIQTTHVDRPMTTNDYTTSDGLYAELTTV